MMTYELDDIELEVPLGVVVERAICAQCESNARYNEAGGWHIERKGARVSRRGHKGLNAGDNDEQIQPPNQ